MFVEAVASAVDDGRSFRTEEVLVRDGELLLEVAIVLVAGLLSAEEGDVDWLRENLVFVGV